MVTVSGFKEREGKDGKPYSCLELTGEIEVLVSQTTGRPYFSARRTIIPAVFSKEVCLTLIGKTLPGSIVKVKTDPYEYTIPESGKLITLDFRWQYTKDEDNMEAAVLGAEFPYEGTFVKTGK